MTSHTDLAPTFLSLANSSRPHLDGKAIPTTIPDTKSYYKKEHVAIEYWGLAVPEGIYGYASDRQGEKGNSYKDNTYKGVRIVSDHYSLYYAVWCTNEVEYYNLKVRTAALTSISPDMSLTDILRTTPIKPSTWPHIPTNTANTRLPAGNCPKSYTVSTP